MDGGKRSDGWRKARNKGSIEMCVVPANERKCAAPKRRCARSVPLGRSFLKLVTTKETAFSRCHCSRTRLSRIRSRSLRCFDWQSGLAKLVCTSSLFRLWASVGWVSEKGSWREIGVNFAHPASCRGWSTNELLRVRSEWGQMRWKKYITVLHVECSSTLARKTRSDYLRVHGPTAEGRIWDVRSEYRT